MNDILDAFVFEDRNDGVTWAIEDATRTGAAETGAMIDEDLDLTINDDHYANKMLVLRGNWRAAVSCFHVVDGRLGTWRGLSDEEPAVAKGTPITREK